MKSFLVFFTLSLMLAAQFCGAQTAYITNYDDSTVSVINVATNTVIDTIKVGAHPYGVAVSPDGSKVYVTNSSDGTVSVINTATNTVSATIPVGVNTEGIAVSHDGSKVYVANSIYGIVSIISTSTNTVSTTITVGGTPWGVSVSPDGTEVYVTGSYYQSIGLVNVINTVADTVSHTFYLNYNPYYGVSISPDGSKLYVTNDFDSTVSAINTSTNAVETIKVSFQPIGICMSPDGDKVYVTGSKEQQVYDKFNIYTNVGLASVINTAADTVSATIITVGKYPSGISVSPDGSEVYVVNSGDNIVSVINTVNNTVTTTIGVGNHPVSYGNFISNPQHLGIPSLSIDAPGISIYPNPATNQLTIHTSSFQNESVMVSVLDVLGREASPQIPIQGERGAHATIYIGNLPAGMYFVEMKTVSGSVVRRFVKE